MVAQGKLLLGFGHQGYGVTESFPGAIPLETVNDRLFGWDAVEMPVQAVLPNGTAVPVPGRVAIGRSDTGHIFNVPSKKYSIHQYRESLTGGVHKILGDGVAVNAAGLLGDGAKAWISVSLADSVTTAEGVEFLPYLIAYGSHDSTLPTGYKRSTKLMICNNVVSSMLREKTDTVKVRHTANSALRLESAQQVLAILHQQEDEFSRQVRELCEIEVSNAQWDAFLKAYVEIPTEQGRGQTVAENKVGQLRTLWESDPMVSPWAGTAFGVVQAVNTWDHHKAIVRNADRWDRNTERSLGSYYDDLDRSTLATLERVLETV